MFGKLIYGQFSLKETFWKFGVLGIFGCSLVTKIFKTFLLKHLKGVSLSAYYTHYFSPLNMDNTMLFFTIAYFVCAFALSVYSIMVLFGVWRSAAEYDKSIWMRHIAKVMILLIIYLGLKFGL